MHAISALLRKFAVSIYLEEESARNLKWKSFASKAIGDQFFFNLTNNINAYRACILRKGHGTDETGEIWCGTGISNIWITVSILWTAYGDQFSLVDNLQVMQTEKGILCPIKRVSDFLRIFTIGFLGLPKYANCPVTPFVLVINYRHRVENYYNLHLKAFHGFCNQLPYNTALRSV